MNASGDMQGAEIAVRGGGTCIYCGSDGGVDGLRDEHIIPFSLGGTAVLLKASCRECESTTSYLDGYLANATYKHLRVHAGVQSRTGHPKTLRAYIDSKGGNRVFDLAPKDHPYFLHMPVWRPPGIMRGILPSSDFGDAKAHVYYFVPKSISDALGLKHGEAAEIQDVTPMPNLRTFARGIAKIAYCTAVAHYGLDGLRTLALPDIILGRYANIPYFVGSDRDDPPPPDPSGILHKVTHTNVTIGGLKYSTVRFRLFAHSGTERNGMPIYEVVVGVTSKPFINCRRPMPKLPRVIHLTGPQPAT